MKLWTIGEQTLNKVAMVTLNIYQAEKLREKSLILEKGEILI